MQTSRARLSSRMGAAASSSSREAVSLSSPESVDDTSRLDLSACLSSALLAFERPASGSVALVVLLLSTSPAESLISPAKPTQAQFESMISFEIICISWDVSKVTTPCCLVFERCQVEREKRAGNSKPLP